VQEDIVFTLTSIEIPQITAPDSFKLVSFDGTAFWFLPVAPANAPRKGMIGDIQADTAGAFQLVNPNSFIFASDLAFAQDGEDATTYVFAKSGMRTVPRNYDDILPGTFESQFWNVDNGIVQTEIDAGVAVRLAMSFSDQFQVQVLQSKVCPEATLQDAGGCFSCSLGFSVRVMIKSTCEEGLVLFSTDDKDVVLFTTSIPITGTSAEVLIHGSTNKRDNSFNLLIAGTQTAKVAVAFTASIEKTIYDQTYEKGTGVIKGGDTTAGITGSIFGSGIDNSFKDAANLSSWQTILIWVAVGVGALVLIIIIGVVIWRVNVKKYMPFSIKMKDT
jgi:hypothetical protein